VRTTLNV